MYVKGSDDDLRLPDYSYLDQNMKTSLFLAWLSCKDFNQLRKEDNFALLEEIVKEAKNSLYPYFKDQPVTLNAIVRDFGKITLTTNPKIAFGYDYERDILLHNLWLFLFDVCGDFASSAFPAALAGHLVYQHDIYLSLQENDIIGKPEDVKAAFQAKHGLEVDRRAVSRHIAFLEKCKSNDLLPLEIDLVKVTAWNNDGHPILSPNCEMYMTPKPTIVALIDDLIKQHSQTLTEMGEGKGYLTDEVNSQMVLDLSKALSLPIKLKAKQTNYPEITVNL